MLQFIATENDNYSLAEQMQMAIEGGCTWVEISLPEADDAYIREIATDIITLCKETSTILTIEDRPELAKELGVHGVYLTHGRHSAVQVRELLGPEAIIGVEVISAEPIAALAAADIDYVVVKIGKDRGKATKLIADIRATGTELAIVARGDFSLDDLKDGIPCGADGISTGKYIARADDPVSYTEKMLLRLKETTL